MRKWVDRILTQLADNDERVRLLIADVGDFPEFSTQHPDKFYNIGVSESNTVGIAAGMASVGLRVYIYGVSSFFLYRAYEQFKYTLSYWKQPVTFIGVGFGWKYYFIGAGHFCPDDINLIQHLPNYLIRTPFTLDQLKKHLITPTLNPQYVRITSNIVEGRFANCLDKGYLLVSYGEMALSCIRVFNSIGLSSDVGIFLFDDLSRNNVNDKLSALKGKRLIVIEDQCEMGGLYMQLLSNGLDVAMHLHLPIYPGYIAPSRSQLIEQYGLDELTIFNKIQYLLANEKNTIDSTVSRKK